jgi:hypothetical protein
MAFPIWIRLPVFASDAAILVAVYRDASERCSRAPPPVTEDQLATLLTSRQAVVDGIIAGPANCIRVTDTLWYQKVRVLAGSRLMMCCLPYGTAPPPGSVVRLWGLLDQCLCPPLLLVCGGALASPVLSV